MPTGVQVPQQGWSQGTAAMQTMMRAGLGSTRRTTTRRRKKSSGAKKSKRASARSSSRSPSRSRSRGGSRLKKGSAAAKAYMARLRKMVKKR